jgi:protocatechuate 3,4-dioxygenase beta subunit
MKIFFAVIMIPLFVISSVDLAVTQSNELCSVTKAENTTSPLDVPPPRTAVGKDFKLQGVVRGEDCLPIAGAQVIYWLANEDGDYDDAHRGMLYTNQDGSYAFESNYPGLYKDRPIPHIHLFVYAKGFNSVETEFRTPKDAEMGTFNVVLSKVARDQPCTPTTIRGVEQVKPTAPERDRVGSGHMLAGIIRDTDCEPIQGARVILWLANEKGAYDDDHRGLIYSDARGEYHFESNYPGTYEGTSPHIHIFVEAEGYQKVFAAYLPPAKTSEGMFDIVLAKADKK